jgi:hypothetical protein
MDQINLLEQLGNQQISDEEALETVKADFTILPAIMEGISSNNPRIKFGCAKILSKVSKDHPEELYKDIEFFIGLLKHENNIIKWNAMDVIANLTSVDKDKKFDDIFKKYYDLINADTMITIGHVVDNSAKIVNSKPYLSKKITNRLLQIEKLPVKPRVTDECKNILYGKAIQAFEQYYEHIENKDEVISFIRRQTKNKRLSTKAKAEQFLRNYQ